MKDIENKYLNGFKRTTIDIDGGVSIHVAYKGSGEPLLMLHGHPETHLMWHKVAPALSEKYTVVLPDLRGYGDSSHPVGLPDHTNYSKRTMGQDNVTVMETLGFDSFYLVGHDRGARVAHRMILDHPQRVKKCMLLDIAPTIDMYDKTDFDFGRDYFHWFFLTQPCGLPERLLSGDPEYFFHTLLGDTVDSTNGSHIFTEELVREYISKLSTPEGLHSICEDYRASATCDLELDRAENERISEVPLMVLCGEKGCLNKQFDVIELWKKRVRDVCGFVVPNCGHYIAEDAPEVVLSTILQFMK